MTEIDVNDGAFLAEQYAIINKVKIELYRQYGQKEVFKLSSMGIEDIISFERQGIYLSPQEYIDVAP